MGGMSIVDSTCGLPANMPRSGFTAIDRMRLFRKYPRCSMEFPVECYDRYRGITFEGQVRNVSKHGCMATIPALQTLRNKVRLTFLLTLANGEVKTLEVTARHSWLASVGNEGYNHGFHLELLDEEQGVAWDELLERAKTLNQ